MKITNKAKTAIKIMIILGSSDNRMSVREIAELDNMSTRYLEQIIALLKKRQFVDSVKGAAGGYALVGEASNLSVYSIIECVEGEQQYSDDESGHLSEVMNETIFKPLDDSIVSLLNNLYLDQLIEEYKEKSNQEYMYFI